MADGFPIAVADDDGDEVSIDAGPWGAVCLIASEGIAFYTFSGERRNAFDQAWVAASHESDRQAEDAAQALAASHEAEGAFPSTPPTPQPGREARHG